MHIWLPVIRTGTGTDIFSARLCEALLKRGINCSITWFPRFNEFLPALLSRVTPPSGTTLIHANSWNAFAFAHHDLPLVVTDHLDVHDTSYKPYKSLLQNLYHRFLIKPYEARSFRLASAITCVSEYTGRSAAKTFAINSYKTIPTWVNTKRFAPIGATHRKGKEFKLLFVGNPSIRKGWDTVVKIMSRLDDNYRLLLVGGAPANQSTLPSNLTILGQLSSVDEIVKLYNDCDALLFPSRLEGLSQVVLEAMSCGLPVITSRSSSMPELITDTEDGFMCEPGNIDNYIKAIYRLEKDTALRARISQQARMKVLKHYCEEVVIPQYIAVYCSVSGQSPNSVEV